MTQTQHKDKFDIKVVDILISNIFSTIYLSVVFIILPSNYMMVSFQKKNYD